MMAQKRRNLGRLARRCAAFAFALVMTMQLVPLAGLANALADADAAAQENAAEVAQEPQAGDASAVEDNASAPSANAGEGAAKGADEPTTQDQGVQEQEDEGGSGEQEPSSQDAGANSATANLVARGSHTAQSGAESALEPKEGEAQGNSAPQRDAYSLRLIVALEDPSLVREDDALLGEHDGVCLIGFADEASLAQGESYYADVALWCQRDVALGAAEGDGTGEVSAVDGQNNAIALLDEAGDAGMPATASKPLVALIDTGAPQGNAVAGAASFVDNDPVDRNGHATAMLETMRAEDPNVRVLAIKALDNEGKGSASSVYAAIEYAIGANAKIINLSLAGSATEGNAAIAEAVSDALAAGCVVVAAAGNGGYDAAYFTPANVEGVFTVGACDEDGNVLESSNRGDCVDGYVQAGSTSHAAARVSGWLSANGITADWRSSVGEIAYVKDAAIGAQITEGSTTISPAATYSIYAIHWFINGVNAPSGWKMNIDSNATARSVVTSSSQTSVDSNRMTCFPNAENPRYRIGRGYRSSTGTGSNKMSDSDAYCNSYLLSLEASALVHNGRYYRGINTKQNGTGEWVFPPVKSLSITDGIAADAANKIKAASGLSVPYTANNRTPNKLSQTPLYVIFDSYNVLVTLDNQSADTSTPGSSNLYVRLGDAPYLDAACTDSKRLTVYSTKANALNNHIDVPSKSGYVFGGYYTQPNGGGTQILTNRGYLVSQTVAMSTFTQDTTLYAYWMPPFVIELNDQGGTGGSGYVYEAYDVDVYIDSSLTTKFYASNTVNRPTLTGRVFGGYYTQPKGQGTRLISDEGKKTSTFTDKYFSTDDVVYALWSGYPVKLDDNGGNGGSGWVYEYYGNDPSNGDGVFTDKEGQYRMTATANLVNIPTRAYYTFAGYFEDPSCTGRMLIDENGAITSDFVATFFDENDYANGRAVIYAKWVPTVYTVLLNDQGADSPGSSYVYERYGMSVHVDENDAKAMPALNAMTSGANPISLPTKAHRVFGGYWTEPLGSKSGTSTQFIDEDGYKTANFSASHFTDNTGVLYAWWKPYTITLDDDGGSGGSGAVYELWGTDVYRDVYCTVGQEVSANPVAAPSNGIYEFMGYYTQRNGGGVQLIDASGNLTSAFTNSYFDSDATIYAYWKMPVVLPFTGGLGDGRTLLLWASAVVSVLAGGTFLLRMARRPRLRGACRANWRGEHFAKRYR